MYALNVSIVAQIILQITCNTVAYACRNPAVGYCQGLNFLAATFLLFFTEEYAFWALSRVVEELLPGYFDARMVAVQVDGLAFEHLLHGSCPRVAEHLDALQVDIPSATSAWFLVAFVNSLPSESMLRIWDLFFFERSPVVLFRAALALIDIYSQALLETIETGDAYALLQAMAPMTCDASALVDTASIAWGHINDAALWVLRDRHRPEVLEAMKVRRPSHTYIINQSESFVATELYSSLTLINFVSLSFYDNDTYVFPIHTLKFLTQLGPVVLLSFLLVWSIQTGSLLMRLGIGKRVFSSTVSSSIESLPISGRGALRWSSNFHTHCRSRIPTAHPRRIPQTWSCNAFLVTSDPILSKVHLSGAQKSLLYHTKP